MKSVYIILVVSAFLWVGFVSAISFMEAWLKFRAPGITVPLGLGIGRLVFNALNKVEWVFAILIITSVLVSQSNVISWNNLFILIPFIILFIQSWYLLPELDSRAEMHIRGWFVEPSNLHMIYVVVEFIKVFSLAIFGFTLLTYGNN
ncbi:MAG: hypothetical protein K0S12_765 [Bacteroidetes bacterium]|jgi:hypothetical protein|nr:hypothetical protein [Bacteroidota bacterium]